ncbi:MAG: HAD hydrolase-like protein [Desulfosarcinaceae bacterium]|jgi:putative hydrolase of the HAD superfamily
MKDSVKTATLLTDIGGVMLTNGWDRHARMRAAERFDLDREEMDERHHLTFDTYEVGKLSLDQYLDRVVFFKDRAFTRGQFREFMFAQSEPFPQMIELIRGLKSRYGLKIVAVSNEGRELTVHRIRKFKLNTFIDSFISSCFVHFRKPDEDIFRLALDTCQTPVEETVYLDDRAMFVQVAESMGIRGLHHRDYESTRERLAEWGLKAG